MQQSRPSWADRPRFALRVEPGHEWPEVHVTGDLDLAAIDQFTTFLATHLATGRSIVRLDLGAVTFMDCAFLRVLVDAHLHLQAAGGRLELTRTSAPVDRLLRATRLDRLLSRSEVQ